MVHPDTTLDAHVVLIYAVLLYLGWTVLQVISRNMSFV
jgi:hypothetical protein